MPQPTPQPRVCLLPRHFLARARRPGPGLRGRRRVGSLLHGWAPFEYRGEGNRCLVGPRDRGCTKAGGRRRRLLRRRLGELRQGHGRCPGQNEPYVGAYRGSRWRRRRRGRVRLARARRWRPRDRGCEDGSLSHRVLPEARDRRREGSPSRSARKAERLFWPRERLGLRRKPRRRRKGPHWCRRRQALRPLFRAQSGWPLQISRRGRRLETLRRWRRRRTTRPPRDRGCSGVRRGCHTGRPLPVAAGVRHRHR